MKALIVVDVQNDFLPGGALPVAEGDAILPVINALMSKYPLVVATQDWHPKQHGSFASANPGMAPYQMGELEGLPQVFWPDHCIQGSHGAELSAGLDQKRVEAVFRKGMDPKIDSYSGFFDNGRKKATGLEGYLRGRGITEVHVAGLAADFCVFYTAMDALKLGFDAAILLEGTRAIDPDGFKRAKESFREQGGQLILASSD